MLGAQKLLDRDKESCEVDGVLVTPEVVDLRFDLQGEVLVDGQGVGTVADLEGDRDLLLVT